MKCTEDAKDLDGHQLFSISIDGPNVNWRFLELLQQEQAEQYGGAQLIVVGSCGLHTLHPICQTLRPRARSVIKSKTSCFTFIDFLLALGGLDEHLFTSDLSFGCPWC